MNLPSKLLEDAVNEFSRLPGIGKKTALRLTLHLLKQKREEVERFSASFVKLYEDILYCRDCHAISETPLCSICGDSSRDTSMICVVQDIRDVLAIENTQQYRGLYHVLGGLISPMDGIGPSELNISSLVERISRGGTAEVITALNTTMEGETTLFYLYKKMRDLNIKISTIARGVAIGDEIEYTDEVTLGRSILHRVPYEHQLNR